MNKTISFRANAALCALFDRIKGFQQSCNRTEILGEAIAYAINTPARWQNIVSVKSPKGINDANQVSFMHYNVPSEEYEKIADEIKEAFGLVKPARTSYVVKLLLQNYLLKLEENEKVVKDGQLSGFKSLAIEQKLEAIYEKLIKIEEQIGK
jgi:hypothetical protein